MTHSSGSPGIRLQMKRSLRKGCVAARPNLETRTLKDNIYDRFAGYQLRMQWREDRYQPLRNAAWLVRNSRSGQQNNPLALRVVLVEAETLIRTGESLIDVLEAFAELLLRP